MAAGDTPKWAIDGDLSAVQSIVSSSSICSIIHKGGLTMLHLAADNGHDHIVQYLLSTPGCDVNAMDDQLNTPLHTCASRGYLTVCERVLGAGAYAHIGNKEGALPLVYIARRKKYLLAGEIGDEYMAEAEIDEDSSGPSLPATHQLALLRVCSLMLNKMIIKGLDIDAVDIRRKIFGLDLLPSREAIPQAPLHAACEGDNDFLAWLFLLNGANANNANKSGMTAVDICQASNRRSLLKKIDQFIRAHPPPPPSNLSSSSSDPFEAMLASNAAPYELFRWLLSQPDFTLAEALYAVTPKKGKDVEDALLPLVRLFLSKNLMLPFLQYIISKEVAQTVQESTLFRTNSMGTSCMSIFSQIVGNHYLSTIVRPLVQDVVQKSPDFELDPMKIKVPEGSNLEETQNTNLNDLIEACESFLDRVIQSLPQVPTPIRRTCQFLYEAVAEPFPDSQLTTVGGFFFLRFVCPSLVTPERFGIIGPDLSLTPTHKRNIILVSKIIQNLSNQLEFGNKEAFMQPVNERFIRRNLGRMRKHLADLAYGRDGPALPARSLRVSDGGATVATEYEKQPKSLLTLSAPSSPDEAAIPCRSPINRRIVHTPTPPTPPARNPTPSRPVPPTNQAPLPPARTTPAAASGLAAIALPGLAVPRKSPDTPLLSPLPPPLAALPPLSVSSAEATASADEPEHTYVPDISLSELEPLHRLLYQRTDEARQQLAMLAGTKSLSYALLPHFDKVLQKLCEMDTKFEKIELPTWTVIKKGKAHVAGFLGCSSHGSSPDYPVPLVNQFRFHPCFLVLYQDLLALLWSEADVEISETGDFGFLHCGIAKIDSRSMTMKVPYSSVCKHSLQLVFYEGKRPYSITLQFAQADFQVWYDAISLHAVVAPAKMNMMMPQQIETTSVNYSSPVSLKKKLKMWKKCELELNKTDLCTTAKGKSTLLMKLTTDTTIRVDLDKKLLLVANKKQQHTLMLETEAHLYGWIWALSCGIGSLFLTPDR